MGYRSDVSIICEENAFEMLKKAWMEVDFEPDKVLSNDNGEYVIQWEYVKWYCSFPDVKAIEDVLTELDGIDYGEEEGYAYKSVIIGEDGATDENCNFRGGEVYDGVFYATTTIEIPSDFAA